MASRALRRVGIVGVLVAGSVLAGAAAPIHEAVKAGDVAAARALLDLAPASLHQRDENGRTPLHWAARGTSLPMLALLVERGADVNAVDSGGTAPLQSLASRGNLDGMRLLLDRGARVNLPSGDGATALHHAALGRHVDAIRLLVSRQADLEHANRYGRTPLVIAAREMSGSAVVATLLELGAAIDAADKAGDTALTLAAWRGSADVVALLLEKGASIPSDPAKARFTLENAVGKGLAGLFQRLLQKGGDVSVALGEGRTLLHSAAEGGSVPIIEALLDRRLEINQPDASGWTPLHYAADMGRRDAVGLLLARGAAIDARTLMGQSALNVAGEHGDADTAALLAAKGADRGAPRFPDLRGGYLGQKRPGRAPEVFAPGIVSARYAVHAPVVFSPDGTEALWSVSVPARGVGYSSGRTLVSRLVDGRWTYPQPAVFEGVRVEDAPFYHPGGGQLYDMASRPMPAGRADGAEHIWVWDRGPRGWTNPRPLDAAVNDLAHHWQFSVDRAGTLYFTSTWKGVRGILCSRLVDGRYTEPRSVGETVNGAAGGNEGPLGTGFPFIAPDGSYLLFSRGYRLHVSFRQAGGAWGEPVALGAEFEGLLPRVSPDGRYLFFGRGPQVFWADAAVIEDLRLKAR